MKATEPLSPMVQVNLLLDSIRFSAISTRETIQLRSLKELDQLFVTTLRQAPLAQRQKLVQDLTRTIEDWQDQTGQVLESLRNLLRSCTGSNSHPQPITTLARSKGG
jgi:hypothetical protein